MWMKHDRWRKWQLLCLAPAEKRKKKYKKNNQKQMGQAKFFLHLIPGLALQGRQEHKPLKAGHLPAGHLAAPAWWLDKAVRGGWLVSSPGRCAWVPFDCLLIRLTMAGE
jgi:hypothetical protein